LGAAQCPRCRTSRAVVRARRRGRPLCPHVLDAGNARSRLRPRCGAGGERHRTARPRGTRRAARSLRPSTAGGGFGAGASPPRPHQSSRRSVDRPGNTLSTSWTARRVPGAIGDPTSTTSALTGLRPTARGSWLDAISRPRLYARAARGHRQRDVRPPVPERQESLEHHVRLRPTSLGNEPQPPVEIVGLVEDAVYRSLRRSRPTDVVLAACATGGPTAPVYRHQRAGGRRVARSADPECRGGHRRGVNRDLALTFRPLADQVSAALVQERLVAMLSGSFGVLALLLAGLGL